MRRRLAVVLAVLAVVLGALAQAPAPVSAQFDPGDTASGESSGTSDGSSPRGRTPRQPRGPTSTVPPRSADTGSPSTTSEPGHSETGATPPAPVGVARSRVRSHVDTGDVRAIALTLDDGYRPDPRILELIRAYGVHGTAFIVGEVADNDPVLINELVRLGWLVCSHTYDHSLLTGRSQEAIRSTMLRGIEAVERAVGYRCPYFRAPYGSVDANVVAVADALGVDIIGWEASISDSAPAGTDPDLQLSIAQEHIRPGSILLGHFGGTNSYEVLSRLLAWLGDESYSVGSVAELIDGTTQPLAEIGAAGVTVDLPGDDVAGEPRALAPAQTTSQDTRPLLASETGIDVAAAGMILLAIPRRFRLRRRRRTVAPPEVVVLDDTVPEWELSAVGATPATATISTEGWT